MQLALRSTYRIVKSEHGWDVLDCRPARPDVLVSRHSSYLSASRAVARLLRDQRLAIGLGGDS